MSNCWLLLLSPQLQKIFHELKMSPTNVLLLTVLVEVRTGNKGSIIFNHTCVFSSLFYPCVCLQHVLIIVKLILRVLIPDEPGWIRKKREHIEFMSMQALKQQVGSGTFTFQLFDILLKSEEPLFLVF